MNCCGAFPAFRWKCWRRKKPCLAPDRALQRLQPCRYRLYAGHRRQCRRLLPDHLAHAVAARGPAKTQPGGSQRLTRALARFVVATGHSPEYTTRQEVPISRQTPSGTSHSRFKVSDLPPNNEAESINTWAPAGIAFAPLCNLPLRCSLGYAQRFEAQENATTTDHLTPAPVAFT